MAVSLTDRIVLITGASSGIGKACAQAFAQMGCKLILTARRLERLEDLANSLSTKHVLPLALDVSNKKLVEKVLGELPEEWQAVDIIVNNAGLALGLEPFQEGDINDWDTVIDTNIKGVINVTRALINGMIKRDHGHIINIGSISGHDTYPNGAIYCATKAALKALSQGLKHDLLGTNVRVSSVDPGMVETEFSQVRFKGDDDRAAGVYANMEALQPEDIAELVVFCTTRPRHVNINNMIVMPTCQASVSHIHRTDDR